MTSGASLHRNLEGPAAPDEMPILRQLRDEGFTDYLIQPLRFSQGDLHAVSWATRRPGGFSAGDVASLDAINRPLARIMESMVLRRFASTLLDTYVGHRSGERVLQGAIRPGDVERIEAAILFTDLRGFTAFSNSHPPEQVIERVNAVFGCIMPAVDAEGGEVLKLIGDGLLAIFPFGEASPADDRGRRVARRHDGDRGFGDLDAGAAAALRHGAACGRGQLGQYRRRQPAGLHRHRPGREPDRPAGAADGRHCSGRWWSPSPLPPWSTPPSSRWATSRCAASPSRCPFMD